MSLNPLTRLAEHRAGQAAQKTMEEGGWGTHLTFPFVTRQGEKLYFQMRLPDGMEMVDLTQLAEAARGAPAFVGHFATAVAQARDQAGVILVGGLRGTAVPEAEREVLATLTVALTPLEKPFSIDDFMPEDSPSTLHSKQDVVEMTEGLYRIHRISVESVAEGRDPVPMLVIEYVYANAQGGVLAAAFATQREDMMGDKIRDLFESIRRSFFLGEKPSAL